MKGGESKQPCQESGLCNFTNMQNTEQGFWYFAEKKAKFCGIFGGKFVEKSADFMVFSREKSQNSRKIGRFRGIFAGEKSKFAEKSADFAGF